MCQIGGSWPSSCASDISLLTTLAFPDSVVSTAALQTFVGNLGRGVAMALRVPDEIQLFASA
eukprot:6488853-Prorocentrum_lima.AAC.1